LILFEDGNSSFHIDFLVMATMASEAIFIGGTNGWGAPVKAQCLCLEVETPPFLLVQPLHKSQA